MYCSRRGGVLLTVVLVLALPATVLRAGTSTDVSAWTSPVRDGARVCQGNGGSASHTSPGSRYAFDYALDVGSAVVAARDGTVCEIVDHHTQGGAEERYGPMANRVVLRHGDGTRSVYAHLKPAGAHVRVGESVMRGEIIGWSGNTGYSTGPHLHFVVIDEGGTSLPIRFADVRRNAGLLVRGDDHAAAPAPALPQKTIDDTRARLRGAAEAEGLGWPGVGLLVLGQHRPRRAHADLPLNLAVASAQSRCGRALEALARQVLETPEPDGALVFRLVRAEVAADRAKAPRQVRDLLHRARRGLPRDAGRKALGLKSSASRLVQAMAGECLGDKDAARTYAKVLRAGPPPIRAFAQARLDSLVASLLSTYDADWTRLKSSVLQAGPEPERALLRFAEQRLDVHWDLLEQLAGIPTERDAELKEALRRMRTDRKEIATLLK